MDSQIEFLLEAELTSKIALRLKIFKLVFIFFFFYVNLLENRIKYKITKGKFNLRFRKKFFTRTGLFVLVRS